MVDFQYRLPAFGHDAGNIVGTVTAQRAGSMALDSPQQARVSYRVEYRDSVKLLSTEELSFVAPRAEQCK